MRLNMENASKALIMAGSVLISMLIIGSFIFMFNSLRGLDKVESTSEQITYMEEYNKKIEAFNRQVYGSELKSLANLMADYNEEHKIEDGYERVQLTVTISHEMSGAKYITNGTYDVKKFNTAVNNLEERIKWLKDPKRALKAKNKEITLDVISSMRHRELVEAFGSEEEANNASSNKLVVEYGELRTELTNFKNKEFNKPTISYSKTSGRIEKITFTDRPVT